MGVAFMAGEGVEGGSAELSRSTRSGRLGHRGPGTKDGHHA
jgi:hypothetical protein